MSLLLLFTGTVAASDPFVQSATDRPPKRPPENPALRQQADWDQNLLLTLYAELQPIGKSSIALGRFVPPDKGQWIQQGLLWVSQVSLPVGQSSVSKFQPWRRDPGQWIQQPLLWVSQVTLPPGSQDFSRAKQPVRDPTGLSIQNNQLLVEFALLPPEGRSSIDIPRRTSPDAGQWLQNNQIITVLTDIPTPPIGKSEIGIPKRAKPDAGQWLQYNQLLVAYAPIPPFGSIETLSQRDQPKRDPTGLWVQNNQGLLVLAELQPIGRSTISKGRFIPPPLPDPPLNLLVSTLGIIVSLPEGKQTFSKRDYPLRDPRGLWRQQNNGLVLFAPTPLIASSIGLIRRPIPPDRFVFPYLQGTTLAEIVIPVIPVANVTPPVVSGTLTRGSTLSCTTGTWTGSLPIFYSYQWLRNGENIFGANSSTYVVVGADIQRDISCIVTAQNILNVASAESNTVRITGARAGGSTPYKAYPKTKYTWPHRWPKK